MAIKRQIDWSKVKTKLPSGGGNTIVVIKKP